ncbi:MAG: NUDIX hydrolase [Chloroflexi bacterium]|nr:NUDIX hydrolase [Chloroflexota bacterium]
MVEPNEFPLPEPGVERLVFETPWWDFYYDDTTRVDGTPGHYSWARIHSGNGGVMIVPVTPSGRYLLIKIYRYPVKRYLWEFPAGMIEDGEAPEEAGRRELIEETGITPESVELLGSQTPVSGFIGDTFYTVLAKIPEIDVGRIKPQVDEGIVDAKLVTRQQIVAMTASQEIEDGVTLMCLARHWAYRELKSVDVTTAGNKFQ